MFRLLYDQPFSYGGENQKCTEWRQIDLEHFTIKSALYTVTSYPWGPNLVCFALRPAVFDGCSYTTKLLKIEKLEMRRVTSLWPWTFHGQKYPIYTLNAGPEA